MGVPVATVIVVLIIVIVAVLALLFVLPIRWRRDFHGSLFQAWWYVSGPGKRKLTADGAKYMLLAFHNVATRWGLPFFLSEGTALGAIRNGAFIDGDSDVDVAISVRDEELFKTRVMPELRRCYGAKLIKTGAPTQFLFPGIGHLDVDTIAADRNCAAIGFGRKCSEFMDTISPLQKVEMHGVLFDVPSKRYLVKLYGADWHIPKTNFKPMHLSR
jgi:hypothetical protein